ncbi:MAG: FAD-dependent oxidoreductase [archaeon]|jgi:thioredoxin reductase (NADPH)|nr:FAD-dependent oxidoreductase [archaeon]MDD2478088.1 FAD-dependent oxidoreductase [Candidatus ainarchaeum sp.]MDD3084936.1 FAD-dependent oxidoreductase [Candidatus ainarchaeum sp.]MDD4221470.1 FAD-dependent oxidoreductase [Candidatus ainarchaeum sp.]MDD4663000.1 FAD-dependent oxidoreductase [Candidatus ainarchaeum sp.]
MTENIYDLVVVGGGPAGMSAALYAGRYKMSTIMFTDSFGGTTSSAHKICNYPGIKEITGMQLMSDMTEQITDLKIPLYYDKVVDIKKENDIFIVNTDQRTVKAKKVILGIGKKKKKLGLKREEELAGKGIHYCATCDGAFYKDKIVGVIGGSDAAVTASLLLADVAKKVYLIYRKDKLRSEPMWTEALNKQEKIEVCYNSEVIELLGEERLEKIKLNTQKTIEIDGLFIEIGAIPNTDLLNKLDIKLDSREEIIVDKEQRTNIFGIFAAGDATNVSDLKQIVTAVSQGAVAAYHSYIDLKANK